MRGLGHRSIACSGSPERQSAWGFTTLCAHVHLASGVHWLEAPCDFQDGLIASQTLCACASVVGRTRAADSSERPGSREADVPQQESAVSPWT